MMSTGVSAQAGKAHAAQGHRIAQGAAFSVIMALSFSHFLNDMMQSLVPALYPMWKGEYGLSFAQLGPILAAFIVIPRGQSSIAWFSSAALLAMTVLFGVGNWYRREHAGPARTGARRSTERSHLPRRKVAWSVAILLALVFSKSFY